MAAVAIYSSKVLNLRVTYPIASCAANLTQFVKIHNYSYSILGRTSHTHMLKEMMGLAAYISSKTINC